MASGGVAWSLKDTIFRVRQNAQADHDLCESDIAASPDEERGVSTSADYRRAKLLLKAAIDSENADKAVEAAEAGAATWESIPDAHVARKKARTSLAAQLGQQSDSPLGSEDRDQVNLLAHKDMYAFLAERRSKLKEDRRKIKAALQADADRSDSE